MSKTNDIQMTKAELVNELERLRQRVAELEERDSHVTSRALFNSIADPVFVFDEETKCFLDCNQAAIERYGYELDELRRMTPYDLHPPDELKTVHSNIDDTDQTTPNRYTHVTKSGERMHVEIHTAKIDHGGHKAWVSVVRDITLRVKANARYEQVLVALAHRNNQLQTAAEVSHAASSVLETESLIQRVVDLVCNRFELAYVGLFLVDQTGQWTGEPGRWVVLRAGTGEAGQKMLEQGHKLEIGNTSMIGWCVTNRQARIALDVGDEAVRFDNPLLPDTRSELALPLISRDRVIGALSIQSSEETAFNEEDLAILQTMADQLANAIANAELYNQAQQQIVERRRVEAALQDSENYLRTILDSVQIGIVVIDAETHQIVDANPVAVDAIGLPAEEVVGQVCHRFICPAQRGKCPITDLGQTTDKSERVLVSRNGEHIPILKTVTPAVISGRARLIESFIDITERKRAEEAIRQAREESERYTAILKQQTAQLKVASEVARDVAAIREVPSLLDKAVRLISDRFGFTHAGIFLIDEQGQYAVLRAASSESGHQKLAQSQRVRIDEESIVGVAAATGEPRIRLDVGADAVRFDDADLPGIHSQIVLPLNLHGHTMGVLDIQSTQKAAFSEESRAVLQTLADQLAIAIEHARLVERTEAQLRELSRLSGKYSTAAWGKLATAKQATGYTYDRVDVAPAPEIWSPAMDKAIGDGKTVAASEPEQTQAELAAPLKVRDQIIGALGVQEDGRKHEWSVHEIALVEAVSEQVAQALENARLFAESRKSAQTMQALYETSRALSSALEQEKLIRATLESIHQTLGCEHALISTVDEKTRTIGIRHGIWNGQYDVFPKWIQKSQFPLDHPDILADVCRTGRTETIDGWDERFNREVWEEFGHERLVRIFMPIKIRDRVLGVIEVGYDRREKSRIGEEEVQMLTAFADQAAVALENVRLFEQAQQRAHREHQTYEITAKIRRSPDISTMLQTTVDELGHALQTDRTLIRLKVKPPEACSPPDSPGPAPSGEFMSMENGE